MTYRLGVDVGGTFTDLLLIDEATGETWTAKVPSTPEDSTIGVLDGVARICEGSAIDPTKIKLVMHGTTVATNAGVDRPRRQGWLGDHRRLRADFAGGPLVLPRRPRRLGDVHQKAPARTS